MEQISAKVSKEHTKTNAHACSTMNSLVDYCLKISAIFRPIRNQHALGNFLLATFLGTAQQAKHLGLYFIRIIIEQ